MNKWMISALALTIGLPACTSGGKTPVSEDFSDLAGLDEKSDAFSYRMKSAGSLDYGQTSDVVNYNKHPRFRYIKFGGSEGDQVDVWVHGQDDWADSMVWVLDNKFKVLGSNDDADDTTWDSHVSLTLPRSTSITHYIVFRDYNLDAHPFVVELKGGAPTADLKACNVDADCVKVSATCCNLGNWTGVHVGNEDAFHASLECPVPTYCPAIAIMDDHSMAECNKETHQCEAVKPADIACGGHTIDPHQCPDRFQCVGPQLAYDAPGDCLMFCGGIAAFPCDFGFECADNPYDDCDPSNGGADCGGLCFPN